MIPALRGKPCRLTATKVPPLSLVATAFHQQGKRVVVVLNFWGSWCGWCIKGFPEMKNYYKKYAIEGYPTKILVDPEGKIARVIIGEDPAFYTFLDEQFGKK